MIFIKLHHLDEELSVSVDAIAMLEPVTNAEVDSCNIWLIGGATLQVDEIREEIMQCLLVLC